MSDAELFIRCDCHDPAHMVIFDVWHWDNEDPRNSDLNVHIGLDEYLPWWNRWRYALQYALTGKTHKHWWAETVIRDADAVRLRDYLNAYLAASLNASADTHPKGGDVKQAPLVSGAVPKADAPTPGERESGD
jgi:hypothetical protein